MSGGPATSRLTIAALLSLTAGTGVIDAVSYLGLGHVFVANMTGNIVFLGFAANPSSGLSASLALIALAAFMFGALLGGAAGHRLAGSRVWPTSVLLIQAVLLGGVAAAGAALGIATLGRPAVVAVLAFAFGLQNSTARRMAVADLTTTVLTLTVTGLAADSRVAGGPGAKPIRRVASIATMLAGAAAGALLVQVSVPLTIGAAALCVLVAAGLLGMDRPVAD
ncbi:YoaK family protein [Mycolicibacterium helvum]|uniref:Membrane protein n=1 Tax=Mycolicibacterium helvum TaxID=1534349 RepID=A0A7I7T3K0_9MYCO|nr:YoaK family protein [Mycolicibacterium helvum]BBY63867.1 membrane protein [Mycolicibacterium helvum]